MRRAPRKREKAIAIAAREASWITDADVPAVEFAKLIARHIDDCVFQAEEASGLFKSAPLASYDGAAYDVQVLIQLLNALGMTPKGRAELNITEAVEDSDELAAILALAD